MNSHPPDRGCPLQFESLAGPQHIMHPAALFTPATRPCYGKKAHPCAIQNLLSPTLARCNCFSLLPPTPPHRERPLQSGSLAGPQQINRWHHAPHVGGPFQSSNSPLLRIKEGAPKLFRTFRLKRWPTCPLQSLLSPAFNNLPFPTHGECPLQFASLAGPEQIASCALCGVPFSGQQP